MKLQKAMDQRKFASSKYVEVEDCDHPLDRYQDLDQGCPLSLLQQRVTGG